MKSKLIPIMLILCIVMAYFESYYVVLATTKTELNNQSSNLDNQISSKKDEIEEKDEELSAAMSEVQTLISKISTYEDAISELDDQIDDLTSQITETENSIAQKEKELAEKQDLLDKRLVAIYESGNTSYLEMLLTSTDLSEFISKYYLISEIAEYDTGLISSIRTAKEDLENSKTELEENKKTIEAAKEEQVQKRDELASLKKEKQTKVANLTAEEKKLEQELEEYETAKKQVQAELAELARKEAEEEAKRKAEEAKKNSSTSSSSSSSSSTSSPSSKGYIFPVAGLSKSNISNLTYPSYTGHTGIDVNINVRGGKSVVAVKAGTVVTSKAMTGSIANYGTDGTYVGSYTAYGEYVIIDHHDGTKTLYAHMQAGSRTVKAGDEVTQGQVIGIVGNTGNVSPRPTSSNPLNGTHLHFEVFVNNQRVNPIPYLP
jgi:peptidoglycan hydrolase CwlO-like protein